MLHYNTVNSLHKGTNLQNVLILLLLLLSRSTKRTFCAQYFELQTASDCFQQSDS